MRFYLAVALGGALGSMARYFVGSFVQLRAGAGFPTGTLVINITGSFLLAFLLRYALDGGSLSPELRLLLTTGFCGGYTTFSTFSYETAALMRDGEHARALTYVGASVGLSLLATFLGFSLADRLLALRPGGLPPA